MSVKQGLLSCLLLLPYHSFGTSSPILILGDSYTSANKGLDTILESLFQSAGDARKVEAITSGGADFAHHAKLVNTAGSAQDRALGSGSRKFGLVVLQDRSHVPAFCCNGPSTGYYGEFLSSLAAVQDLDRAAEKHGARTVLLQTWGRRDGAQTEFLSSFEQFNDLLIRGYDMYSSKITRSDRAPLIAPVGSAFGLMYNDFQMGDTTVQMAGQHGSPPKGLSNENLWRELYSSDGSHPSVAGSYLAACVLYATITNQSPIGLIGVPGIASKQVVALQHRAHDAVLVNASVVSAFKEVEGRYSSTDPAVQEAHAGFDAEIRNGFVVWPEGIRTALKWKGSKLQMFFHGKLLSGSSSNGVITWDDGDVWTRKTAMTVMTEMTAKQSLSGNTQSQKPSRGLARREAAVTAHALEAIQIMPGGEQVHP